MNDKELKEHFEEAFEYDLDNGKFYWKIDYNVVRGGKHKRGELVKGWNMNGYIGLSYKKQDILSHRLVFLFITNRLPKEIDHINGNRQDNRTENLREVTRVENQKKSKTFFK